MNRRGAVEPLSAPPRPYGRPRLSPDGGRLAVEILDDLGHTLWIFDLDRQTLTRLSEGARHNPLWTPDGKRILFQEMGGAGRSRFLWQPADASAPEELLTEHAGAPPPGSWSPDGKLLAFSSSDPKTLADIWVLPLDGRREPRVFLQTPWAEFSPNFSPDGRWLAYVSDESRRNEVYVRPFPGPGQKWQVSTAGGNEPVWARSGREIFYIHNNRMMAVPVTTTPHFAAGRPQLLFEGSFFGRPLVDYDVTPDGQRFLMIQQTGERENITQLRIVLNWFEELKRLVPVKPVK